MFKSNAAPVINEQASCATENPKEHHLSCDSSAGGFRCSTTVIALASRKAMTVGRV